MPVAIVTGAGARIGQHLALALAKSGFDVAVHFRQSHHGAEETVHAIRDLGQKSVSVQADLARADHMPALVEQTRRELGAATVLINSASLFEYDLISDWTIEKFDHHSAVNLRAPLALARHMMDVLPTEEKGCVVNILDQKLFNLNPDFFTYTISKLGLKEATPLMAQAMAPRCRVNAIAPGLTLPSGEQTEEQFQHVHPRTPLCRGVTMDDIAGAMLYFVYASAVTGAVLPVDAGQRLCSSDRDVMFIDTKQG